MRRGYRLGWTTGLVGTPTPGLAYVNGTLVSSSPGAHVFTASKDTYRWLGTDGTLFYREVETGAPQPDGPSGALLVGVTLTDASGIVSDVLLCDWLNDAGEAFRASS